MLDFLEWAQEDPWRFLVVGYFVTIAIETPILFFALSPQHSRSRRVFAGLWLTACTYPLVVLVVPQFFDIYRERTAYLLVAESIAHFGECILFWAAFRPLTHFWRDMAAVFGANLVSFGVPELLYRFALE